MTPATFDDVTGGAEGAELRTLVWDAAAGLPADDRALLDLHLRQGLDGADLGEALGVSAHNATVRLGRVRDLVERSLGALLVSRTGRRDCPELDGLLAGWDGGLTPLLRKRVARHIEGCAVCGERKRRMVSPTALLAAVPMLGAPAALRDRVLDDVQLVSAARTADDGMFRKGLRRIGASVLVVAGVIGFALLSSDASDDPVTTPVETLESTTTTSTTTPASTATSARVVAPVTTRPRPPVSSTPTSQPAAPTTIPDRTTTTPAPTTTTTRRSPTGGAGG
jgi:hypothetical protein